MKAKIIKISKEYSSKHGGKFRYLFFKDANGKTAKTCIYANCRNKNRWTRILHDVKKGKEVWVKGLVWKNKAAHLIDADSMVERIPGVA